VLPPTKKIANMAVLPGAVWVAISGAVWGGHQGVDADHFEKIRQCIRANMVLYDYFV
jgi:hypothetical protein